MQLAGWRLSETFVLISDYANKQLCHAPGSAARRGAYVPRGGQVSPPGAQSSSFPVWDLL